MEVVYVVDKLPFYEDLLTIDPVFITSDNNFNKMYQKDNYQSMNICVDDTINSIKSEGNLLKTIQMIIVIMIIIFGFINLSNILNANLLLRSREFGILRAVGIKKKKLQSILVIEGIIYGVIGSSVGMIVSLIFDLIISIVNYSITNEWKFSYPIISVMIVIILNILLSARTMKKAFRRYKDKQIVDLISNIE